MVDYISTERFVVGYEMPSGEIACYSNPEGGSFTYTKYDIAQEVADRLAKRPEPRHKHAISDWQVFTRKFKKVNYAARKSVAAVAKRGR